MPEPKKTLHPSADCQVHKSMSIGAPSIYKGQNSLTRPAFGVFIWRSISKFRRTTPQAGSSVLNTGRTMTRKDLPEIHQYSLNV